MPLWKNISLSLGSAAIISIAIFAGLSVITQPPLVTFDHQNPIDPQEDSMVATNSNAENKSEEKGTHSLPERPQPPLRIIPKFPEGAQKSGHCLVDINFDDNGKVDKAKIENCTDPIFEKPTLEAVYKWVYPRRFRNGEPVPFKFTGHKVSYRFYDENGNIVPE